MIVLTNLGPKYVDLIFYAPNVANLGSSLKGTTFTKKGGC